MESDDQIFNKLSKIVDSVNPVADEDCWKRKREFNTYLRQDMAAQKLNQWQKTDDQKNPTEDPQAAASDTMHKEDLICQDQASNPIPNWRQGHVSPEAPGQTLDLSSGTNDLPS